MTYARTARQAVRRNVELSASVTTDGEVLDGLVAVLMPKRKNGFQQGGWFAMSSDAIAQLLTFTMNRKLTLRDLQTLYAMLEYLELENWIRISQTDIASRLHMAQPHVSRSVKTLLSLGIILIGPKIGTSRTYRLSPDFGWKGGAVQHVKAQMAERMKAANIKGVVTPLTPPAVKPERDPATVDFLTGKADQEMSAAELHRAMKKIDQERAAETAARIYDEVQ